MTLASPIAQTEPAMPDIGASSVGTMSVPDVGPVEENASAIPTEKVSDMPFAGSPTGEEIVVAARSPVNVHASR
jgi:hypothetical protein